MPEGGGGGGHAVLEGSYELHDTVGTGGFAKVISRLSKNKFCLYLARVSWPHELCGQRIASIAKTPFLPSACRQVFLRS